MSYAQRVIDLVTRETPGSRSSTRLWTEVLESLQPCSGRLPEVRSRTGSRADRGARASAHVPRCPGSTNKGTVQVNRGYRIEFNSAIGPYKGGLRCTDRDLSILKFPRFEQVFKNSLTTLPMGGAKGGSDFDPKASRTTRSCASAKGFMSNCSATSAGTPTFPLATSAWAGREIGLLFGQYKAPEERVRRRAHRQGAQLGRLAHPSRGTLPAPCTSRKRDAQDAQRDICKGKICTVSGSGNVAQYTVEKLNQRGCPAVTLSDSDGFIHDPRASARKSSPSCSISRSAAGPHPGVREEVRCEFVAGKRRGS